jgi:hypothetical protein
MPTRKTHYMRSETPHSGHCRACKERLRALLTAAYGECRTNVSFPWPAHSAAYVRTPIADALERVRAALGDVRGHRDFIKSAQIPPCDFYVPAPAFIVEFDESQHFTKPRLVSLSFYPDGFNSGFSLARWRELCRRIDARDDTPIDRDERRAWYDALRDLVPPLHGLAPTARLYAEETAWCALNPTHPQDVDFLRQSIERQPIAVDASS